MNTDCEAVGWAGPSLRDFVVQFRSQFYVSIEQQEDNIHLGYNIHLFYYLAPCT